MRLKITAPIVTLEPTEAVSAVPADVSVDPPCVTRYSSDEPLLGFTRSPSW